MTLVWSVLQILVMVLGWIALVLVVGLAVLVLVIRRRTDVGSAIAAKVMTQVMTRATQPR